MMILMMTIIIFIIIMITISINSINTIITMNTTIIIVVVMITKIIIIMVIISLCLYLSLSLSLSGHEEDASFPPRLAHPVLELSAWTWRVLGCFTPSRESAPQQTNKAEVTEGNHAFPLHVPEKAWYYACRGRFLGKYI